MTTFELVSVATATGERLDSQWALFITVHLALFGAIIYIDRPLRVLEKIGAILIYAAFAVFNFRLTLSLRNLLERCALELTDKSATDHTKVVEYFSDLSHSGHFARVDSTILVLHLVAFATVLVAVGYDGVLKNRTVANSTK